MSRLLLASGLPRLGSDEPKVSEAALYGRKPKHSVIDIDTIRNLARINGIAENQQGEFPFETSEIAVGKRINAGCGVVPIDQPSLQVDVHRALPLIPTPTLIIGVTVGYFIVYHRATCSEGKHSKRSAYAEACP